MATYPFHHLHENQYREGARFLCIAEYLVELLLGKTELPFPEQYLDIVKKRFCDVGFDILDAQECFRPIKFFDIGALVWFAHIIE